MDGQETKGLVGLLFDFSFTEFVTTRLIKALYVSGVVLIGLWSLAFLLSSLTQGAAFGFIGLLITPFAFLVGVAFLRVQLELVMVIFRIADNTSAMAEARATESE